MEDDARAAMALRDELKEWKQKSALKSFVQNEDMEEHILELEKIENRLREDKEVRKFFSSNTSSRLFDIIQDIKTAGHYGSIGFYLPGNYSDNKKADAGQLAKDMWSEIRTAVYELLEDMIEYSVIEMNRRRSGY